MRANRLDLFNQTTEDIWVMSKTLAAIVILFPTALSAAEVEIPRSVPGDKGRYFLLSATRNGDVITALHKRVGVESVGWTTTETNCTTMLMRELGYSEVSPDQATGSPTKWFKLAEGSSKSDLAKFVCR